VTYCTINQAQLISMSYTGKNSVSFFCRLNLYQSSEKGMGDTLADAGFGGALGSPSPSNSIDRCACGEVA
jgi:hypothetical protein